MKYSEFSRDIVEIANREVCRKKIIKYAQYLFE